METGKTQPSVSTLYALVNYLGISLDALMGTKIEQQPDASGLAPMSLSSNPVVQRRDDNPLIEMENGVTWERLAVGDSAVADPLVVTYAPGGSSSVDSKLMRHAGLEYGYLLEGRLTLKLDFDTFELEPGDSFCFDSGRPHLYLNASDRPAKGCGSSSDVATCRTRRSPTSAMASPADRSTRRSMCCRRCAKAASTRSSR